MFLIHLIILISCFNIQSKANNATYYWENTVINIAVGSDLEDFIEKPKCIYVLNGSIVNDKNLQYERGSNDTFLSTVNTNVVGQYKVYYTAYFFSYGISFTEEIIFNVYDNEAPQCIFLKNEIKTPYGVNITDIRSCIIVTDNSTPIDKIKVIIDDSAVNYNQIGTYQLAFYLEDLEKNRSYHTINVVVYDDIKPVIALVKEPIVNYGEYQYKLLDFVVGIDNVDDDITDKIEIIDELNPFVLGIQPIKLRLLDSSNNETLFTLNVKVEDVVGPTITLKKPKIIVLISELSILAEKINENMVIEDNLDNDIEIIMEYEIDKIGIYSVKIIAIDDNHNQTEAILEVDIIEDAFEFNNYFTFKKGEKIDLKTCILDNNPDLDDVVVVYSFIDWNKAGIYQVIVNYKRNDQTEIAVVEVEILESQIKNETIYTIIGVAFVGLSLIIYKYFIKKRINS